MNYFILIHMQYNKDQFWEKFLWKMLVFRTVPSPEFLRSILLRQYSIVEFLRVARIVSFKHL